MQRRKIIPRSAFSKRGIIKGAPVRYSQEHAEIGGKRHYYKSKWERNYARFLEWRKGRGEITDWVYEGKTFWFEGIKRGTTSYKPDFGVTLISGSVEYHEVKGYMDAKSATKLKRMTKYHPIEKVIVIDKGWFARNKNLKLIIKTWE
jgi:hypothetical protein